MARVFLSVLAVVTLAAPALAGEPVGKTLFEHWDAAYLRGARAGYVRTVAEEVDKDGVPLVRTTVELRLKLKRFSDTIELAMDTGTWETPDGKVSGTFMRQYLGKTKRLDIVGTVAGNRLDLKLDGSKTLAPAPWREDVLGLVRQQTLLKDRAVKPGDTFSYPAFEPSVNLVLATHVSVKEPEEVELFAGKMKRKLLRVETKPQQVEKVQLPAITAWLDESYVPLRAEMDIPLLDKVTLYRTTKAVAVAPSSGAGLADIGFSQLIRANRKIVNPYETTSAVYRVTVRDDNDPASVFAASDRQSALNIKGNSFELHVRARRGAGDGGAQGVPAAEFLQSSYFINCDDPTVRQLARQAVSTETDPWQTARRIEKWVNARMRLTNYEALATADHVARTLQGDCTEFAMLTAALCRAEGVPTRTAVGLLYADVRGQPSFAFHMWTEVWVKGEWVPIDATLGKGYVGATHLKICDQSWHDTRNMTPLFPVVRVLGRVSIDVVGVDGR